MGRLSTLFIAVLMSCAAAISAAQPAATFDRAAYGMRMVGVASFYSDALHGHRTADGSRYDRDSLTCAHLYLPLGTMLRVRNLGDGREVEVRVSDRGPFSHTFVVDLSYRAAEQLGVVGAPSYTRVMLTPVDCVLPPYRYVRSWTQEEAALSALEQALDRSCLAVTELTSL